MSFLALEFLERFGGHSQACGLTILGEENYKKFLEKINQIANERLKDVEFAPSIEIDIEVKLANLNWELMDELEKFEPFAEANPMPLFLIRKVKIEEVSEIGKNGGHLRFLLSQDGVSQKAISFGTAGEWKEKIKAGDVIDVVVEFGINEWKGKRELQLKVVDIRQKDTRYKIQDTNKFQ